MGIKHKNIRKQAHHAFSYITPVSLTDRPILGMVVGNNKTLMIDAGNSEDHAKYFIKETLKQENVRIIEKFRWF